MPVTNQKPDNDLAEDMTALQENFKQKNKFRQTVTSLTVSLKRNAMLYSGMFESSLC